MKNNVQIYNEQINFEEGKIYFAPGKGYTSKLMERLYSMGYRATTAGIMHYLNDEKGHKVTTAYSWEGLLLQTAILMR